METRKRAIRKSDGTEMTGEVVTDGERMFMHNRISPIYFTEDSLVSKIVLHEIIPESLSSFDTEAK